MISGMVQVATEVRCYSSVRGETAFRTRLNKLSPSGRELVLLLKSNLSGGDIIRSIARGEDPARRLSWPDEKELRQAEIKFAGLIQEIRVVFEMLEGKTVFDI